ncbi:unnamed protein product [Phytophthora lilii]|uniref:Unnamed protein product n=1 Tax=Phytophthora lilii TaxID=2077276 RepID=A0A9W6X0Q8_9STRA|nr:unnamed protein product [Phytophthora lilii]
MQRRKLRQCSHVHFNSGQNLGEHPAGRPGRGAARGAAVSAAQLGDGHDRHHGAVLPQARVRAADARSVVEVLAGLGAGARDRLDRHARSCQCRYGRVPVPFSQFLPMVPMSVVGRWIECQVVNSPETKARLYKIDQWLAMFCTADFDLPDLHGNFYDPQAQSAAVVLPPASTYQTASTILTVDSGERRSRHSSGDIAPDVISATLTIAQKKQVSKYFDRKTPSRYFSQFPKYQDAAFMKTHHELVRLKSVLANTEQPEKRRHHSTLGEEFASPAGKSAESIAPFFHASYKLEQSNRSTWQLSSTASCTLSQLLFVSRRDEARREVAFVQNVTSTLHQTEIILLSSYITFSVMAYYGKNLNTKSLLPKCELTHFVCIHRFVFGYCLLVAQSQVLRYNVVHGNVRRR